MMVYWWFTIVEIKRITLNKQRQIIRFSKAKKKSTTLALHHRSNLGRFFSIEITSHFRHCVLSSCTSYGDTHPLKLEPRKQTARTRRTWLFGSMFPFFPTGHFSGCSSRWFSGVNSKRAWWFSSSVSLQNPMLEHFASKICWTINMNYQANIGSFLVQFVSKLVNIDQEHQPIFIIPI